MTKPAPGPDQPPIPVRLVTFNVHHGVGQDERFDLPRLARVLKGLDADVLCLQEVDRHFGDRSEGVDEALLLSRALDMQLAWGPAIEERRAAGPDREFGNALLSRLPILVSDVHQLPASAEPRIALRTMLELDGAALWVTTTHLDNDSAEGRAAQATALTELLTEPMETGVVAGDFNAPPDAPELAPLRERFVDAWEIARGHDERSSAVRGAWRFWQNREGGTFPASRPTRRIDHVWVSQGVRVAEARVVAADGASDHLPVVVDLEVPSGL
jgi:endonuclease/exonuclease/phosphatase family metal-dependent hydrolase